jgi:hypothetical protein
MFRLIGLLAVVGILWLGAHPEHLDLAKRSLDQIASWVGQTVRGTGSKPEAPSLPTPPAVAGTTEGVADDALEGDAMVAIEPEEDVEAPPRTGEPSRTGDGRDAAPIPVATSTGTGPEATDPYEAAKERLFNAFAILTPPNR